MRLNLTLSVVYIGLSLILVSCSGGEKAKDSTVAAAAGDSAETIGPPKAGTTTETTSSKSPSSTKTTEEDSKAESATTTSGDDLNTIIVDTTIPAAPTITLPGSATYLSKGPNLIIAGSCAGGPVTIGGDISASDIVVPGASLIASCMNSEFTFTVAKALSGSYHFKFSEQRPSNGNRSSESAITWLLDNTVPANPSVTGPGTTPYTSGDTTIAIAGACETDATVHLSGAAVGSTICAASTYGFSITKSSDSTYDFTIEQTDAAGNTSGSTSFRWIRDRSIPATPTVSVPATSIVTNDASSLTVSGGCITGHTVTLAGDVDASEVTIPAGSLSLTCSFSAYSFTIGKAADGTYDVTIRQTNTATSQTSQAASQQWVRDDTNPTTPTITSPAQNPLTSGGNSITISGACETGATVSISGDHSDSTTCSASAYSLNVPESSDNTYSYSIVQTDAATNQSSSASFTWTRNVSIPEVPTRSSPPSASYTSSESSLTFAGACVTGNTVTLGGSVVAGEVTTPFHSLTLTCSSSAYSFTIGKSADGIYTFTVTQTNPYNGNVSAQTVVNWGRDSLTPVAPSVIAPAANPLTSGDTTIAISGSCEASAIVNLAGATTNSMICTEAGTYSFSSTQNSDNTYAYTIGQTDQAGNASASTSFTWIRDTMIPTTPSITTPASSPAYTKNSSFTIAGACTSGNTVTLVGDVIAADVTVPLSSLTLLCSSSAYSFTLAKSIDSTYNFAVFQSNAIPEDSAQAAVTWVRDTNTPSAPVRIQPSVSPYTASGNLMIWGTCEAGATVNLTGDDSQAVSCSDGTFALSVSEASDAAYNYTISQTDSAGNQSASFSQQWIKDSSVASTPAITYPSISPYTSSSSSLAIFGGCQPGLLVTIGGEVLAAEITAPSGSLTQTCSGAATYSFTVSKAIDDTYDFTIKQTNNGVDSGTASVSWRRDVTAPVITIGSAPNGRPSDPNFLMNATFTFTSDDPNAALECRLDAGSYVPCTSPVTYSGLSNESHTFAVRGTDSANNIGSAASYTWSQQSFKTLALYHFTSGGLLVDSGDYSGVESNDLTDERTGTNATGKFGASRTFTAASSQYLRVADNNSQDLGNSIMTVEAFVKFTTLPQGYMTLISKNGSSPNLGWQFKVKKQGNNYILTFSGNVNGTVSTETKSSSCGFATGTWYHVAVTYQKGSVKFYCNGVAKGTGTIGTAGSNVMAASNAQLRLGATGTGTDFLNGELDEVRISQSIRWNAGFTPTTVEYVAD